jgi:hypothetical protein
VNSRLKYSIGLTIALSLVSQWTSSPDKFVPALDTSRSPAEELSVAKMISGGKVDVREALPSNWPVPVLEAAQRDVFSAPVQAIPPPPALALALAIPAPVAPPLIVAQQPPPTMSYRFLGKMLNPQGEPVLYLIGQGDQALAIKVGDRLEGGWLVRSVDDDAVHLFHPLADLRAVVAIPAAQ